MTLDDGSSRERRCLLLAGSLLLAGLGWEEL